MTPFPLFYEHPLVCVAWTVPRTCLSSCPPSRLALHRRAQKLINSRLITSALRLQPRENVGIEPNRQGLLDRAVKLTNHTMAPIAHFRRIRQIDLGIAQPFQRHQFLSLFFRGPLHRFSFPPESLFARK